MRVVLVSFAALLISAAACFAQESPPADGVGLGNQTISPNSTTSNVPSMSPDQNSVMTDTNGSTTGDKGAPAFAGAPSANTATRMNSQGTGVASDSTSATATRRESYEQSQAAQKTQRGTAKANATKGSGEMQKNSQSSNPSSPQPQR